MLMSVLMTMATGAAMAQFAENGQYTPRELGQSGRAMTRAQVVEELARARANGELDPVVIELGEQALSGAQRRQALTRQEVKQQFDEARRSGELRRLNDNDQSPQPGRDAGGGDEGGLTREQVKAELARARAAGELDHAFHESFAHGQPYGQGPVVRSATTRAEVKQQLDEARRSGELRRLNDNDQSPKP